MNGTQTSLEKTEISNEADWALAGLPDSINATGLLADDLEEYGGLTEIQTLILACVATVIPLFLGLLLILGVRMVWKKYKNHNANGGYDNDGLRREDSCDAVKSSSFMQSAEELKASESQYSVLMPDDAAACCYAAAEALPPLAYNSPPNNRFGDTNKTNLNGSIITLTMKNNHLIVETEERVLGNCATESTTVTGYAAAGPAAAAATPSAAAATAAGADAADRSADYDFGDDDDDDDDDDDEFDMEAEMLRREFREASLLANGCGGGGGGGGGPTAAVLEPSVQTQVDLTADRRPAAAADHSSGGSSSADSRAAETAYAYGNQSEYTAAVKSAPSSSAVGHPQHQHHQQHHQQQQQHHRSQHQQRGDGGDGAFDDEYLVEQRLLGNGADGRGAASAVGPPPSPPSPPLPPPPDEMIRSPDRVAAVAAAQ